MPNRSERTFVAASKGIMAVSTLLVGFFAAIVCSTDAAITGWEGAETTTVGAGVYTFDVLEGTPTVNPPITVKATSTATVTYTLASQIPANGPFTIADTSSGVITLKSPLDFETAKTATLTITAVDGTETTNAVTATAKVTINVLDVLKFAKEKDSVCVPDGTSEGTEVASVKVADKTTTATYAITDGNTGNVFTMNGETIKVASGKATDKATTASYNLTVTATDNSETATFVWMVKIGDCSAASVIITHFGLLTIMVALVVSMN